MNKASREHKVDDTLLKWTSFMLKNRAGKAAHKVPFYHRFRGWLAASSQRPGSLDSRFRGRLRNPNQW
jgi:hypothetical protein